MLFAIALGGALGAVARYGLGGWAQQRLGSGFPWGTLIINITGSILLAFLIQLLESLAARPEWRGFLAIGFCGAYTTFSTFSYESIRLLQGGQFSRALLYMGGSVLISLYGTLLGFRIAASVLALRG